MTCRVGDEIGAASTGFADLVTSGALRPLVLVKMLMPPTVWLKCESGSNPEDLTEEARKSSIDPCPAALSMKVWLELHPCLVLSLLSDTHLRVCLRGGDTLEKGKGLPCARPCSMHEKKIGLVGVAGFLSSHFCSHRNIPSVFCPRPSFSFSAAKMTPSLRPVRVVCVSLQQTLFKCTTEVDLASLDLQGFIFQQNVCRSLLPPEFFRADPVSVTPPPTPVYLFLPQSRLPLGNFEHTPREMATLLSIAISFCVATSATPLGGKQFPHRHPRVPGARRKPAYPGAVGDGVDAFLV